MQYMLRTKKRKRKKAEFNLGEKKKQITLYVYFSKS